MHYVGRSFVGETEWHLFCQTLYASTFMIYAVRLVKFTPVVLEKMVWGKMSIIFTTKMVAIHCHANQFNLKFPLKIRLFSDTVVLNLFFIVTQICFSNMFSEPSKILHEIVQKTSVKWLRLIVIFFLGGVPPDKLSRSAGWEPLL